MTEKVTISEGFLAALKHYSQVHYDPDMPHLYRHADDTGWQSDWPLEYVCSLAYQIIANEELSLFKLETIKRGMRDFGAHTMYEKITGEKLK